MKMTTVILSKQAQKDLAKIPWEIQESLAHWIRQVGFEGLAEVRKISGYHDEPLKGERKGQRSVRLNKLTGPFMFNLKTGKLNWLQSLKLISISTRRFYERA